MPPIQFKIEKYISERCSGAFLETMKELLVFSAENSFQDNLTLLEMCKVYIVGF